MPFYPKFGCRERRRQALMHRHGRPDLADTHGKCSRIGSHREEQSKEKKASVDADTRAAAPLDGQAEARSLDDFTLVEPHTHLWKQPRLNQFDAGHVHIGPSPALRLGELGRVDGFGSRATEWRRWRRWAEGDGSRAHRMTSWTGQQASLLSLKGPFPSGVCVPRSLRGCPAKGRAAQSNRPKVEDARAVPLLA